MCSHVVGEVKQGGDISGFLGQRWIYHFTAGREGGGCQRSHSVLRTVSAVQNWKLAGKAALNIDQSEASVGNVIWEYPTRGGRKKTWVWWISQDLLLMIFICTSVDREADMTDVISQLWMLCWSQPCQRFTLWNTNVRGFLFNAVFSRNIFAFQHLIRKISLGQSRIIFLLCDSGFFYQNWL